MTLKIEETFQLQAPIDQVWNYLTDPRQVVTCLPGAELTSVESETVFLGEVKVKVGPITAAYNGKVTITERDDVAHVVRMIGDGRESGGGGGGSAKMTMTSTLTALPNGGTEVRVTADLDIVGRLAQFGRGMIESVNKQMFKQFTDCVRTSLQAAPPAPALAPTSPARSNAVTDGPAATVAAPATVRFDAYNPAPAVSSSAPTAVPTAGKPVHLVPVLIRALWENLVELWRAILRSLARVGRGGR